MLKLHSDLQDGEVYYRSLEDIHETLATVKAVSGLSKGQKYYVQFRNFEKKVKVKTAAKSASDAWNERELLKGHTWQVYVFEKRALSDKKLGNPFYISANTEELLAQGFPCKKNTPVTVTMSNGSGISVTLELNPNWDIADVYRYDSWVSHTYEYDGGKATFKLPPHMSKSGDLYSGVTHNMGPRSDDLTFSIRALGKDDGGKDSYQSRLEELVDLSAAKAKNTGEATIAGNPTCWISIVKEADHLTCETTHLFSVNGTLVALTYGTATTAESMVPESFRIRTTFAKQESKSRVVWSKVLETIAFG